MLMKGKGVALDEVTPANVVPIEDLPALASQGAGRGVMLMSIVQDLSQLRPMLHHLVKAGNTDCRRNKELRRCQQWVRNSGEHLLRQRIIG